ncbi:MAG TPA: hypothetical protein VGP41_09570 [Candidatus Lustribacter sp.]|nr:hypothetical protein [Candidatus Lustribacter sp.]
MRSQAVPLLIAATILTGVAGLRDSARADSIPAESLQVVQAPSPAPTEKPAPKFSMKIETYTSGTNNQMVGPGTTPAEGAHFAAGGVPGPGTPYDFFSGSPTVTGEGLSFDFLISPTYAISPAVDVTTTLGYGSASGTGNVINYWGDALMPSINPNLGSRAFQLAPAFPTHNGQNPVSATNVGFLSGAALLHNGNGALTVGWLNTHQNVPWVFTQAPWTTTPFELAPQLPQSIGDGPPSNDTLKPSLAELPLSGADFWVKDGITTLEVTSANLPMPYGTSARILSGSMVMDQGSGLKYSAQVVGLSTAGPETGSVLFGSNATLTNGVPQSTVFGQHMVVAGAGVTFPVWNSDAEFRYGYSCYGAVGAAASTSSCTSGNYVYGKVHHGFSAFDLALEGVNFGGSYAPAILNYGTVQNVWTYPSAWPGTWLRGSFQLVDNSEVGPNRIGIRAASTFIVAGVEVRLAFAQYQQIQPLNMQSALAPGFVDPYFLPQVTSAGTIGYEQHWEGWFNYRAKWGDLTLDLGQVNTWRAAPAGAPQDNVQMQYPGGVFTFSRNFGPKVFGTAGVGRFALNGAFDTSGANNASLAQNLVFAGIELRPNGTTGYGVQWRLYSVNGNPTIPGGLSPAYHGPQIQFYQRFKT